MDECPITGNLIRSGVRITDPEMIHDLVSKGFGHCKGGDLPVVGAEAEQLFLDPFEALYLLYTGRMTLNRGKNNVSFDSFLKMCKKDDPYALTRFLIYRDLRTRGYVAKDGFGFGVDFRVYERGQFMQKGSKFLIFGLAEGQPEKVGSLQRKIREITQMGKDPIMAVIDRHGEIIYYKINTMEFHENRRTAPALVIGSISETVGHNTVS